jgi:hypothetical protein
MNGFCDLHIHTYYSDGVHSPTEVVEMAKMKGLSAIAITDHDSVSGIEEGVRAGERRGIEVVHGVELSSQEGLRDVHILGYLISLNRSALTEKLRFFREERVKRAHIIIKKLRDLGISIELDEILQISKNGSVGRPHIAQVLLKKGYVSSIKEAFDKYIGYESPAYVPKYKMSPKEAISLIRSSGGIPVYAHPGVHADPEYIVHLSKLGLMGIEVWHPDHSEEDIKVLIEIADRCGLIKTGGTDFHGIEKGKAPIGEIKIPCSYLNLLKMKKMSLVSN